MSSRARPLSNDSALAHGVVGMNFRNLHLVASLNPRAEINVARDKVATKERLARCGVPVAPTLGLIRTGADVEPVYRALCAHGKGFVVKPSRSAQGRGILMCRRASTDGVELLSGRRLTWPEWRFHLYQILHGEYSFGRPHDAVLIEHLLETDADWIHPGLSGPPDLRIIVCRGKVLMAMGRLPSSLSEGRANLHCGGVGVGIDLETGHTTQSIQNGRLIERHPDTGKLLGGLTVKDFPRCLEIALRCGSVFGLGYMGVDIMRDIHLGPVVLEVNARPGLAVQLANRQGLLNRLNASLEI